MKKIMCIAQSAGGVERYLYTLIKYIDKEKYSVVLVCSRDYNIKKFEKFTFNIEVVDMNRNINAIKDIKNVFEIRKIIKKYNPDIVYTNSSKAGAIGRIANMGFRNLNVYNAHGWSFNMNGNSLKKSVYAIIEKILAKQTDKIIVISDFEKQSALKEKICVADKMQVIYNGIDLEEYEKSLLIDRRELNIPSDSYVVGTVGRLSEQKAPDVFVKAAKLIKKHIPNAYFIMVGDGQQKDEIKRMIEEEKLENSFLITGWVNDPYKYINIFDVATLLSRWEGFGLVLAEYMLAKKPIVATNVDAIPDIIKNGENGFLVEKDDYNEVAEKIIMLHKNDELINYLVSNGERIVRDKYNVERVALQHQNLFEVLMNREK